MGIHDHLHFNHFIFLGAPESLYNCYEIAMFTG